jgi:hypothetical protein
METVIEHAAKRHKSHSKKLFVSIEKSIGEYRKRSEKVKNS